MSELLLQFAKRAGVKLALLCACPMHSIHSKPCLLVQYLSSMHETYALFFYRPSKRRCVNVECGTCHLTIRLFVLSFCLLSSALLFPGRGSLSMFNSSPALPAPMHEKVLTTSQSCAPRKSRDELIHERVAPCETGVVLCELAASDNQRWAL